MTDAIETDLQGIMSNVEQMDWRHSVYLESVDQIDAKTKALVLDPDEADWAEDNFTPIEVFERGFKVFISIHDLQMVVSNLKHQKENPTLDEKIAAAIHYFERDAYLVLDI